MNKHLTDFLFRIKLKIYFMHFKKKKKIQDFVKWCIFIRVRNILGFKKFAYNKGEDIITYKIANHFLNIKKLNEGKLSKEIKKCKKDEKFIQLCDLYNKFENDFNRALDKDSSNLDYVTDNPIIEDLSSESLRKIKRILKKIIKEDYIEVNSRTEFKFDFTLQNLLSYLTFGSSIIFCGAYLYNYILFNLYEIKVEHFFSTTDYIDSSINQISIAIYSALISLIIYFYNFFIIKNNLEEFSNSTRLKRDDKINTIFIFAFILYFIIGSIYLKNFFFTNIEFPVLLFSIIIAQQLGFNLFKKPFKIIPILVFCFVYIGQMVTKAISNYYLNEDYSKIILIYKNEKLNNELLDYKLITTNNEYLFLLKDKKIKIISKENVLSFENDFNK